MSEEADPVSVPDRSGTERVALIALLLWATLLQTLVIGFMPISISNDSWGYIRYADQLIGSDVFQRTIGLPFLLAVTGVPDGETMIFFVFVQSLMMISLPFLAYFTLRPFSKPLAYLIAAVGASTLFPYVFALQLLTESLFMWLTALLAFFLSRYAFTGRLAFLVCAVLSTIAIALVRVSGTVQFGCVLIVLVLMAALAWRQRHEWQRYLVHGAIAIAIFGAWHVVNGQVTHRTAGTIMPFFVFNWVYRSGTEINYGIVSADNGPRTREFLIELEKNLRKNPAFFRALAQFGSPELRSMIQERRTYDADDVHLLMHDLVENTTDPNRGFMIPWNLAADLGPTRAADLLWGAIIEAFVANPSVIVRRAERAIGNIPDGLKFTPGPALYVTAFWKQVPEPGSPHRQISSGMFAEWVHGLNLLAGSDTVGRDRNGHFPATFGAAWEALSQHRNFTGFGNYVAFWNARQILPVVWILMLSGGFFALWSRNPALGIGLVALGAIPPFLSVLISEVDTRHFWMAFPAQLVAAGIAVDGAYRMVRYLLGRLGL